MRPGALFEWEPSEVSGEEVWETMRNAGLSPEGLEDPNDRVAYRRWLKAHPDDEE